MKKLTILLILSLFLSSCATFNSSPQYIQDYNSDINNIWLQIKGIPLKYNYSYKIASPKETTYSNMPEIKENCIYLPKAIIDYIYKYYYNNRNEILICLYLHEIAHTEYNLPSKPVETHYLVDKKAFIDLLLPNFPYGINEFYNFLYVMQNYNETRKGIEKHLFNIAWNTLNTITYLYAGMGSFGDWFSYDISNRLIFFKRDYPSAKFIFKRSSFQRTNK